MLALGCGDGEGSAPTTTIRIYVVNNDEPTLSVIDHATRSVVDTVALGAIPHGQIPAHAGDRLYVATEDTREIIAIDTRTNAILWRVEAGASQMHQPSLTADDRFVFAPDLLGGRLAIVDTRGGRLDGEVVMADPALSGDDARLVLLHNTYLSADGRSVYSTAIASEKIARVGVESRAVERVYHVNGQPRPAAITRDQSKMYVQLSALIGFVEIDLSSGEETARIELPDDGSRPDGWDGWTHSHGLGINPAGTELWTASTVGGKWYVYSLPDLRQLAVIAVGALPNWITFTPDGRTAYVTNTAAADPHGTVSVIDAATREIVATISVGKEPKRIHAVAVPRE